MILKLALSQVVIPEGRQRKEFDPDAMAQLMDSIVEDGLRHPLSVREENGTYILVNGERRYRAVCNLAGLAQPYRFGGAEWSPEFVPVVSDGEMDPLAAESAEFAENEHRTPLTWQERAAATARLADLRRRQAVAEGRPQPRVDELAREVRRGSNPKTEETVRRELILAGHLNKPEIAGAKNADEAWKVLVRGEEAEKNAELARTVGASFGAHSHVLVKGDCVEWLRAAPAGQFDVILTDPPYGIGADGFGDAGGRLSHQTHTYEDTPEAWNDLIGKLGSHWFRVAKEKAHLYVCCDIDGFASAREWLGRVGWRVHRTPLVNYKVDGSRVPWPQHGPQRKYELILYAVKGNRPVTRIYPDVIETRGDENLSHGAQKPVALFKDLLQRSVRPGDAVLDCFAGTGTTIVAGHELLCRVTAIEVDEVYYGVALKRLKELT